MKATFPQPNCSYIRSVQRLGNQRKLQLIPGTCEIASIVSMTGWLVFWNLMAKATGLNTWNMNDSQGRPQETTYQCVFPLLRMTLEEFESELGFRRYQAVRTGGVLPNGAGWGHFEFTHLFLCLKERKREQIWSETRYSLFAWEQTRLSLTHCK